MTEKILVQNKFGIHLRAAAQLARLASSFSVPILVKCGGRAVNAKSLLGILELAVPQGAELEIEVQGENAPQAISALRRLVEFRFGEPE